MIIGKNSLGKGALLFFGAAIIIATSFVSLATDGIGFKILGLLSIASCLIGAGKIYKSMSR